jgi:hypothetical protein
MGIVQELGDCRFGGPDGESHLAGFMAQRFAEMGWKVERREVMGSGFPRWAVSWAGWLCLGIATTGAMSIVWTFGNRWPTHVFCWPLLVLGAAWLYLALHHGFRFGWGLPPRCPAPIVMAHRGEERRPVCRVVFQTPLGRLSANSYQLSWWLSSSIGALLFILLVGDAWFAVVDKHEVPGSFVKLRMLGTGLIGLFWIYLVGRCISEIQSSRSRRLLEPADRIGVAILLEMARTWTVRQVPHVATCFAATGGQALDFAGARTLFRSIGAEPDGVPTLFVLCLAPGIGQEIIIASRNLGRLAQSAANSLWVPHTLASRSYRRIDLWPSDRSLQNVVALIGAGYLDWYRQKDTIDPAALQFTAQLAAEVGLRWAKQQQPPDSTTDSPS